MTIERKPQNQPDPEDEPTPEEIEQEQHRAQTWKHPEDGKELSDRDEERPLKP
ncbi:hypothetical protein [Pseudomonas fluorescens]|uniref:Uncharacterized protein n=1 Tax=Pseudomonas fluorescens TaxID=294 RepID=A0A5E7ERR9_PSEFL|nr:hypothetical protein [Pseudomonas fluorescens]VVO29526.1 hypothetical protein PS691_04827 [Pseudomonas fluorescens]